MKRVGNLIEQIADYDNIQLAFIKSRRGKQAKQEVIAFRNNYDENIKNIRESLLSGNIHIGNYNYFKIFDPKERLICAASFRERVIHHAIMNVCHDYFDRTLISDTYATRRGKGVYVALNKAVKGAARYRYIVKLDYRKYFDSIDHDVLKYKLVHMFKDKMLLSLFGKIIDSYETTDGKGLPIGNLTSQYFANHYLSSLDHMMKEQLNIPIYIRYMDDILMMADEKVVLQRGVCEMIEYSETVLKLKLKSPIYRVSRDGIPFLGYHVKPHYLLLTGRSKRRFRNKIALSNEKYSSGVYTEREYQQHILPLIAFVKYAQCQKFRMSCYCKGDWS